MNFARKDRLAACASLVVLAAVGGCGGGRAHNYATAIAHEIEAGGTQEIQQVTNTPGRSGRATINNARCLRTTGSQQYSCIVDYTYENSEGTYRYEVGVSARCDNTGRCRWRVSGAGTLVAAEPD